MGEKEMGDREMSSQLVQSIASVLGCSVSELENRILKHREAARRRVERANLRYAQALRSMSDVQALIVAQKEAEGYKVTKLLVSRVADRVAVQMLKRPVWDERAHRMGAKLMVVYPDGSTSSTFERSVSIRRDF